VNAANSREDTTMKNRIRQATRIDTVATFALFLLAASLLAFGCDKSSTSESTAEEPTPEMPAVEWTPAYEGAHAAAQKTVGLAIRDGMSRTIPKVRPELMQATKKRSDARPDNYETHISVLFGANVHGELEDCGCRANPLGGLSRRKTLIDLADEPDSEAAQKWWESAPAGDSTIFVADAGDLLYKSTSLNRATPALQEKAKLTASAIIDALNASPPDVVNVGELELVFGRENIEALTKNANFPMISANLTDEQGEHLFSGSEVVEREGVEVAFIGLTKQNPRIARYYSERGVKVEDPRAAYIRELEALPADVDLVVMLSNLGIDGSRRLVEGLAKDDKRVDAVVVSNSNRRTRTPVWASGVPMVEPASRGKYYGRLDLMLGGDGRIQYANAAESPVDAFQDYVSAWSSYANARSEREHVRTKIAEFRQKLESSNGGESEKSGSEESARGEPKSDKALQGRIGYLEKRMKVLETRVERASESVAKRHANLKPLSFYSQPGEGDDWAEAAVVDVHIDIPEDAPVKKVVDRWKKKIEK
jgi:2',3'-cyclic-nucleotide 2'-phosphodiesterase (5'-nucleotidase family)